MNELEKILEPLSEYIENKKRKEMRWIPGEDWVSYSGDVFSKDEYIAAIKSLVDGWLVFGKKSRQFEEEFVSHLGMSKGVLTNSGSSANLLMVSALKSKNLYNFPVGTKIITPIVCFPTTVNPILQSGFIPVFVDSTLPDLNLDLEQVERVLEEDTDKEIRAIMFAHALGNPPNMDKVMDLVKRYDLVLLEDACDALGSTYDGKKLGSFGDMSSCSFYPAHHMTLGEGGFVATNKVRNHKVLLSLRDWGRACYCNTKKPGDVTGGTACGNRFRKWLPQNKDIIYDHRYVYSEIGFNLKPIEMQAAIGLEQLKKVESFHSSRVENFNYLLDVFKPYEKYFHLPKATEKSNPSWFAFLLTIKESSSFSRADFVEYLEEAKIQTRNYFSGNLLYHPAYSDIAEQYGDLREIFPVAHKAATNSFFLGTYPGLTKEKLKYIRKVVNNFFSERRIK